MAFNVVGWAKSHGSVLVDMVFYFMCALFAAMILSFLILAYKTSILHQNIGTLNEKILVYASEEQKASEKEVLFYKKKIDDFATIINNHNISSNIFSFIEENTLPNVWFLSFNVLQAKGEISLLGESENMEALSNQVRIFESNKNYVNSINVFNSQITQQGTVRFTLAIALNQDIFKDTASKTAPVP